MKLSEALKQKLHEEQAKERNHFQRPLIKQDSAQLGLDGHINDGVELCLGDYLRGFCLINSSENRSRTLSLLHSKSSTLNSAMRAVFPKRSFVRLYLQIQVPNVDVNLNNSPLCTINQ